MFLLDGVRHSSNANDCRTARRGWGNRRGQASPDSGLAVNRKRSPSTTRVPLISTLEAGQKPHPFPKSVLQTRAGILRRPACYDAAQEQPWLTIRIIDRRERVSGGARGGKAAAGGGRHQRLYGAPGAGHWLSRALSLRRRSGRQLARHARPRHQHHGRRAHRCAPHHRRHLPAAAGRHRHRLGRRLQHRPHHPLHDQGGRGRGAHGRPGRRQALRPPAGQGTGCRRGDGRPHQGRRRCPHRCASSSSWRAPTRWPARVWPPRSSARRPTLPPAPT